MQDNKDIKVASKNEQHIYLSIDHLKDGNYTLDIILDDNVIKSITIRK